MLLIRERRYKFTNMLVKLMHQSSKYVCNSLLIFLVILMRVKLSHKSKFRTLYIIVLNLSNVMLLNILSCDSDMNVAYD